MRQLVKQEWPRVSFRTQSIKKEYQDLLAVSDQGEFSLQESCRRCRSLILSKAARYMERVQAEYLVVGNVSDGGSFAVADTLAAAEAHGLAERILVPLLQPDPFRMPAKLCEWSPTADALWEGRGCAVPVGDVARYLGLPPDDPMGSELRCRLKTPGFGDRVASLFAGHAVTLNALCLLDFPTYMTAQPDIQIVLAFDEQEKRDLQNYFLPDDLRLYPATPHGPMMLLRTNWEKKSILEKEGIVHLAARLTATHACTNGERMIPVYCRLECDEERQLRNVSPFLSVEEAIQVWGLESVPLVMPATQGQRAA
ncbi:MAG TPA: hypothetical protein ENN96_00760 [Candidatus Acetothermia bacterium]|nr:hypothetical protein [Candidatus Acetothermia bacterium]